MAKNGFVPAWMKLPSSDKTNGNQKLNLNRSNHPTIISGRQRHHSSDIVDHTTTRHTLFYYSKTNGQSQNKFNEQQNFFSFQFRRSSNDNHSDIKIKTNDQHEVLSNNNENLSRTFRSNLKDRLLSTPNNFNLSSSSPQSIIHEFQTKNLDKLNSLKNDLRIEETKHHYNRLSKQTLLLLSAPETSEEKELLIRMGWNDDMTYEITDKDKEEYEKRLKLLPKINNQSARLMSALNRRTLPYINIQDIFQLEMIGSISDDDSLEE